MIDAIGAVVLGGTSLNGGRVGILQTVIGLLFALVVNVVFSGRSARDRT